VTTPSRVFELRTYQAGPGQASALNDRFRTHTLGLFARHGMEVIGFWVPREADGTPTDRLVYLLAFADREAAAAAWEAFRVDPDWVAAKADSERDGPLAVSIESVWLDPTDYSPLT
jgi:hypothetical protein